MIDFISGAAIAIISIYLTSKYDKHRFEQERATQINDELLTKIYEKLKQWEKTSQSINNNNRLAYQLTMGILSALDNNEESFDEFYLYEKVLMHNIDDIIDGLDSSQSCINELINTVKEIIDYFDEKHSLRSDFIDFTKDLYEVSQGVYLTKLSIMDVREQESLPIDLYEELDMKIQFLYPVLSFQTDYTFHILKSRCNVKKITEE